MHEIRQDYCESVITKSNPRRCAFLLQRWGLLSARGEWKRQAILGHASQRHDTFAAETKPDTAFKTEPPIHQSERLQEPQVPASPCAPAACKVCDSQTDGASDLFSGWIMASLASLLGASCCFS